MEQKIQDNIRYHFNSNYITNPKTYGKINLYQIGDIVCNSNHVIHEHTQLCFELTCVVDGEIVCYNGNEANAVNKNMIYLSMPKDKHRISVKSPNGARFYFLGFEVLPSHPLYQMLKDISINNPNRIIVGKYAFFDIITSCLQEILSLNVFSDILIEGYLNQIIILLIKSLNNEATLNYKIKDKDLLFANVISYVENNIYDIAEIKDICDYFSFSESYLSHLFSEKLNVSLYQYFSNVRFEKALQLLNGGKSVTEVSDQLNYNSIYTFSRAFKNKFGISPTQYIKDLKP